MKKKLKIAQIAPLWTPVPPKKYGGVELIVHYVTEELVNRGHDVTLFASGDSKTSAKLRSYSQKNLLDRGIQMTDKKFNLLNMSEAIKDSYKFDIIHSHFDVYDHFFIPFSKCPVVSTVHTIIKGNKTKKAIFRHYKDHNFISISYQQRKQAPKGMNFVANIYNGIKIKDFKFNENPRDHYIWVGRFADLKGPHEAIRVALETGEKLLLAGKLQNENEKKYFKEKIEPFLKNKNIEYVGEISRKQKSDFFGNAKGLLNPIKWEEPFGLVMAEAMACGTPVIAFNRGSVPEVVEDGKTGFVVNRKQGIGGIIKATEKIEKIDRKNCRKRVEKKFTTEKMIDDYEKIYYRLLGQA